jgi:hypothetical protein
VGIDSCETMRFSTSRGIIQHRLLIPLTMSANAVAVNACPICDSDTGRQVRTGIFGADFAANAFTVLAPFPVLLLLIAALRWALPTARDRPSDS